MFPLWVVGKGGKGNPLIPLQEQEQAVEMRGIQVREGQKRVTKVAVGKLAVGAGKGQAGEEI